MRSHLVYTSRVLVGLSFFLLYSTHEFSLFSGSNWSSGVRLIAVVTGLFHMVQTGIRLSGYKYAESSYDKLPFMLDYLLLFFLVVSLYDDHQSEAVSIVLIAFHSFVIVTLALGGFLLWIRNGSIVMLLLIFGHGFTGYFSYKLGLSAFRHEYGNTQLGSFWAKSAFQEDYYVILNFSTSDQIDTVRAVATISVNHFSEEYEIYDNYSGEYDYEVVETQYIQLKELHGLGKPDPFEPCELVVGDFEFCTIGQQRFEILLTNEIAATALP